MDDKTREEAERRRAAGDGNREISPPTKTVPQIFATNIFTYFNAIFTLLAVGIIIADSWRNLAFMGVVVINTAIGIIQELRSKKTLDRMALLTEQKCVVVRDGEEATLGVHDTVKGDTVKFGAGAQIFADAKVLSGEAIVNEALMRISKELEMPLVATNDVHYIEKSDAEMQDILMCIQMEFVREQMLSSRTLGFLMMEGSI